MKEKNLVLKMALWVEWLGWLGAALIVVAFALVSFSVIEPTGFVYPIMNLFGGLGIILEACKKRDMQPVVLNIFFCLVAIVAIVKSLV